MGRDESEEGVSRNEGSLRICKVNKKGSHEEVLKEGARVKNTC